ncbi:MAG: PH domain-containing protein [Planctomycetota bacterium]
MSQEEKVVWEAKFNDKVATYWLMSGIIGMAVTVIGIPLIPIWFFVGRILTKMYLDTHQATLTSRTLRVSKGIFVKVEKAVPLDRLTDVGVVQGPIMRAFEVESLSVETAGQSAVGSLIHLTGIENGREFKEAILKQRDLIVGSNEELAKLPSTPVGTDSSNQPVLERILEVLQRIESKMDSK